MTTPPRAAAEIQKKNLSLLVLAHLANDSYFGFLPPILPLLLARFGWPVAFAGILTTSLSFSGAVGQPIFGYYSDRFRKGWLIALGPLGMSLTGFLIFAPNFAAMYLLLLVAGVGSSCFHPIAVAMANRVSGARKGFGVSLFVAGGRLGVAAGAGMATFILAHWGLEGVPFASVFGIGLGISLLFLAPRIKPAGASPPADLHRTLEALRGVVRSMSMLWGINACRTASTVSVLTFIPIYIVSEGGSVVTGGRMVTFFLFAAALGGVLGGYVSDRIGRRRVLIIGFAAGLPSLALVFLLPDPARTAFLMLAGAALYAPLAVAVTYAQELLPGSAAFASSLVLGVTWFMGSLGVVLVGVFADAVGIRIALPLGSLAYVVLGLVFSVMLPEGPPEGGAAGDGGPVQR